MKRSLARARGAKFAGVHPPSISEGARPCPKHPQTRRKMPNQAKVGMPHSQPFGSASRTNPCSFEHEVSHPTRTTAIGSGHKKTSSANCRLKCAFVPQKPEKDPLAIVPIANNVCSGCGLTLPVALVYAVRAGEPLPMHQLRPHLVTPKSAPGALAAKA